jgi:hypothetical protein
MSDPNHFYTGNNAYNTDVPVENRGESRERLGDEWVHNGQTLPPFSLPYYAHPGNNFLVTNSLPPHTLMRGYSPGLSLSSMYPPVVESLPYFPTHSSLYPPMNTNSYNNSGVNSPTYQQAGLTPAYSSYQLGTSMMPSPYLFDPTSVTVKSEKKSSGSSNSASNRYLYIYIHYIYIRL